MPKTPRKTRSPLQHAIRLALLQPLVSIPFALFFGTLFGAQLKDYVLSYKMSLVFAYCVGTCIWVVRNFVLPRLEGRLDSRYPLIARPGGSADDCAEDRPVVGIQIGLWFVGASLVGAYVAAFIIHRTLMPGFLGSPRAALISGMYTLLFSGLFTGINYAIVFYRQAVERARAVEMMRAELAEAELRALRAQINPHFLFNTLNTIASLINENPRAAEETTTRLADVFRYTLTASDHGLARFGDELTFLRSYLEIERTRFGERLRIEEAIEPGLESMMVPSLLLQPVVENAVRYGIAPRVEGGTIHISARRAGGVVAIEISDDGPGMNGETRGGAGFGLHSVRERLRAAGLGRALEIESEPGQGTRVRITLPPDLKVTPSNPEGASS